MWNTEEQEMQRRDSEELRREHEADLRWEYRDEGERGGDGQAREPENPRPDSSSLTPEDEEAA